MTNTFVTLRRDENQALGLGRFAGEFLRAEGGPSDAVVAQVERFHRDSVACAVSAVAYGAAAPTILRREAESYPAGDEPGATCFGSTRRVKPEKAIVANCSAVREWDANGTNFGYDPARGNTRGEFGHNDFYPVVIAAAQQRPIAGETAVRAMILLDEIRGRLAEVFALRAYKIDHVLHGAIASAVVYGALLGATPEEIESAVGLVVAHYVPFRAIRAGHQLSDSKGASAAISTEAAIVSLRRAMAGFRGPGDVFRNPEALFCLFEKPPRPGESPFDLTLATAGDDFAVRGMHFKLGLYEHQSAGAIGGLLNVLAEHPELLDDPQHLRQIEITIYEPAFSIIGDPAKRNPTTRQSADHSMVYIVATLLRKAFELRSADWSRLMLLPEDYDDAALVHPLTRALMARIDFRHGGAEYDRRYPDGIPTTLTLDHSQHGRRSSGLVMYPPGHARCGDPRVAGWLDEKFHRLASQGVDDPASLARRLTDLRHKTPAEVAALYEFVLRSKPDGEVAKNLEN